MEAWRCAKENVELRRLSALPDITLEFTLKFTLNGDWEETQSFVQCLQGIPSEWYSELQEDWPPDVNKIGRLPFSSGSSRACWLFPSRAPHLAGHTLPFSLQTHPGPAEQG